MPDDVTIELLGGFTVRHDGREIGQSDWPSRRSGELVALLALSDRRRLVRDRVVDQLWPHLDARAGAANLRKAAHYARRALGDTDAVVLRGDVVELFPERTVTTDVETFLSAAAAALDDGRPDACAEVAGTWPGELLPDAPYESWTQDARRLVHDRLVELLRRSGDLERLLDVEPTDEAACRDLMRVAIRRGRRHTAIRRYEQVRLALAREAGTQPDPETRALYDQCTTGIGLAEPVFIGRELELAEAMGALADARRGGATALLVRGSVGIGKSALCREIAQRATADGWRVLTTAGIPSRPPYGPVAAALEQLLVSEPAGAAELPGRTRSVVAELTPVAGAAAPLAGPPTRHQVVAAVRRALAAHPAPTLLVLDDAHLADEATADVLHQLVVAEAGCPLVVLLACRSEWMRTSLPRGVAELGATAKTRTIRLPPLAVDELAQLVAAAPPASRPAPDVVDAIVRNADGNPFFALELARTAPSPERLPPTVREAIANRFLALKPAALDAVAKLALTPGELDLQTVRALTGGSEDETFAMLDAALDAGVLVVAGTRYAFRHELVRQALGDQIPPHRRLGLHRDAAARLAAAGAAPELVAYHHLEGGQPEHAVPSLLEAARRAAGLGAFADALGRVERVLALAPDHHAGLALRARILDALGDRRAPDAYGAAARAVGGVEAEELTALRALAQLKASDPASALRTLEGCTPRTTAGRLAEALTLSAAAAIGAYADADTAEAKADEAHRLALELGDPGAILDATWAHALAAHAKGRLPARLHGYLRGTAELPEIATRVFDGQLCVTERMLHGGVPNEDIIEFADSLGAEAERLGAVRGRAFAFTLRGEAEFLAGRLDEADDDFAEGARLHGKIGAAAGEALSLLGCAQVATARGEHARAQPHLANALVLARESEVGHHTLDRVYGAMLEAAPDPDDAVALLAEAESAIRGPAETCPTCRIAFVVPAAIAASRAGDLERAHRYARDCRRALEVIALPPAWQAAAAEVQGWLARAEQRPDDARASFRAAAGAFAACGQPLDGDRCERLAAAVS